jgi:hypothetical protein
MHSIWLELSGLSSGLSLIMGSVGEDYVCPWCGRMGAGGYAPDPLGYPICTEPPHACLDHWLKNGVDSKQEYDECVLRRRFDTKLVLPDNVWTLICELLSGDGDVQDDY